MELLLKHILVVTGKFVCKIIRHLVNGLNAGLSVMFCMIIQVRVVLRKTVVGDHFDYLSSSHLQCWLWRWLPLGWSKCQSPTTFFLKTTLTQTIMQSIKDVFVYVVAWFQGVFGIKTTRDTSKLTIPVAAKWLPVCKYFKLGWNTTHLAYWARLFESWLALILD